jgi:septal ring-binding cell division protein DamX
MKKTQTLFLLASSFSLLSACTPLHHPSYGLFEHLSYDELQTVSGVDYTQYPQTHYTYRYYPYPNDAGRNTTNPRAWVKTSRALPSQTPRSPVLSRDSDKSWVESQNPQGYTIEIADDEKPAYVANQLHNAPKKERMAEIKYQKAGKPHYKGLYGSYNNPEDAKNAMNALPPEIKSGAGVKDWKSVQGKLNE